MIKGVLFDFSGTLFRITPARAWLDGTLFEIACGRLGVAPGDALTAVLGRLDG